MGGRRFKPQPNRLLYIDLFLNFFGDSVYRITYGYFKTHS